MAARGNDRQAARNRARERRLALDADRLKRDERVDEAVADFEVAADTLREAQAAVAAAEAVMGAAVAAVLAEGETVERAAALCEVSVTEVRRLAKLAQPSAANTGKAAGRQAGSVETDSSAA